jgi:hypothetical protein
MKYTVEYLTEQLKEATKVSRDLNVRLEAEPDSFGLMLSARAMSDHIEEIKKDLVEALCETESVPTEPSDAAATYIGKVSMLNAWGAIDLQLADGRVIHGRYPDGLFEKIRNIHLGDQLKCTVDSNTVVDLEPVLA